MNGLDLPTEKKEEEGLSQTSQNQDDFHLYFPSEIKVEISNPIVLGFQLGCGFFTMALATGIILFLIFLASDIAM